MEFLKGKSSLTIFNRHANLKYKYENRTCWTRGYYVDTVGHNKERIKEYLKNQFAQDQIEGQMNLKEFIDLFKGSKNSNEDSLKKSMR